MFFKKDTYKKITDKNYLHEIQPNMVLQSTHQKNNLRLKILEGNAKFPQFLFSKKIEYRISL
jgi:hypothetical protein